ncbi:MAG: serine hydrolase domain-containing protein [Gammaproteobacteria bacterium]|nr:serine hydrolase [Gammaproteobacteria bacterium]
MYRRSVLLTCLFVASLAVTGIETSRADIAVPASHAAPRTVLSKKRLANLERVLQQYVDEERIAGAVALVLQDGETVYEGAVGWRDKEAKRPMTPDTIFRIASQSKAITSAAILQLVEDGSLALSNPVTQFIPEFAQAKAAVRDDDGTTRFVPLKRPIVIRDLLTHTSGYSYGREPHIEALYAAKGLGPAAGNGWYTADKDEPICDTIARLGTLPTIAQPGEAYVYGYSTDILGCIIERASGLSLDAYLRTKIFEPLGMHDTHFFLPKSKRERLATVYASGPDGKVVRAPEGAKGQGHYVDGPRKSFSGGAGLLSTARDYARFLEMIRNHGTLDGRRILGPRAVALMRTNQIGTLHAADGGLGFGYGFQTVERYGANGMDEVGAFGWGGAYGTIYRVDPASGTTMVFMMQLMPNHTDIHEKVSALVYQALEEGSLR